MSLMNIRKYSVAAAVILVALLIHGTTPAAAQSTFSRSVFSQASGTNETASRLALVPCTVLFARSMVADYRLRGHWPERWADVVAEGIFQTRLTSPDGSVIEPDDGHLDFMYDLVYEPSEDLQGVAHCWFAFDDEGLVTKRTDLEPGQTYADYFEISEQVIRQAGDDPPVERYQDYLGDDNMLRLFAILHCLNRGSVWIYTNLVGGYPPSAEALIDSGYSCVDMNSINPVTGLPFRFDGSPGDIGYIPEIGRFYHVEPGDEYPVLRMDY